jgi:hypothetical protein
MRKTLTLVAVAVAALSAAGLAIAHYSTSGMESVSATFSAAKAEADTRSCIGSDGTYEITRGRYEGTSTSTTAALAGAIELHVKSVYNTTEHHGFIHGWIKIRGGEDGHRAKSSFFATLGDNGALDGFMIGRAGYHEGQLFANIAASFNKDSGFTNGKIGGGATGDGRAVLSGRLCEFGKPGKAVRVEVKGTVEQNGPIAPDNKPGIVVKPVDGSSNVTCFLKDGVSPSTQGVAPGAMVGILCGMIDNQLTLLKLRVKDSRPAGEQRFEAGGVVEALSDTEIKVKTHDGQSKSCAITPGVSPTFDKSLIKVGETAVEMLCGSVNNVPTLLKLVIKLPD